MLKERARWVVSGPWYRDRVWFVQNENARIHPVMTRKWFDSRAEARAYAGKMNGRRKPTGRAHIAEVRRLRAALRRALRLLDEGMGDTDVTHRDDPLADAYRTLSRALEKTDKRHTPWRREPND